MEMLRLGSWPLAFEVVDLRDQAQRQFDPTHLVFGEKHLAGEHPDAVLNAGAPYIDVPSIQPGDRLQNQILSRGFHVAELGHYVNLERPDVNGNAIGM